MPAFLLTAWLAAYLLPFLIIAASWNRLSFAISVSFLGLLAAYLWYAHIGVPIEKQDLGYGISEVLLRTMTASIAAGIVARAITLISGWRQNEFASLAIYALALATPFGLWAAVTAYESWERRPPSTACLTTSAFRIKIGTEILLVPNWPVVRVYLDDDVFSLNSPIGTRQLCESTDGAPLEDARIAFDFSQTQSHGGRDVEAWRQRQCTGQSNTATFLACGQKPFERLSIYPDADFKNRTISFGRVPSHRSFSEKRAAGQYPQTAAWRHENAWEYPNGTWAFEDGSVFSCRQYSNGQLGCTGDLELAPKILAKIFFLVPNGDVEDAQQRARQAAEEFYRALHGGDVI